MKRAARFTLNEFIDAQPRRKTQREIAHDLGLSDSQLSLFLKKNRMPSRKVALRLSKEFGFSLDLLLDPRRSEEHS